MTKKTNHLGSLEKALDREEHRNKINAERERREEQNAKTQLDAAKKLEKRYAEEKKALANSIFDWGKEFSQTDIYHRLLKSGIDNDKLHVFCGRWAHELPYNTNFGCWSRTYLKPDGTFAYMSGYKYHGISTEISLRTTKEMANKLCFEYLKELVRTKETLEIYKNIRDWNELK